MRFRSERQRRHVMGLLNPSHGGRYSYSDRLYVGSKPEVKSAIKDGTIYDKLNAADTRSERAKNQDWNLEAKKTLPINIKNVKAWAKKPDRIDLIGHDTKQAPDIDIKEKASAKTKEDYKPLEDKGLTGVEKQNLIRKVKEELGDDYDKYDIEAHVDPNLTYSENVSQIKRDLKPTMRELRGDYF